MTTYTYQGNGDHFPGIPARDLTERDVARLGKEQVTLVEKSGLYEKHDDKTPSKAPKGKGDATPATD